MKEMFEELKNTTVDRRSLLRSAGGFALSAGALSLLAGCGGNNGGGSTIAGLGSTAGDLSRAGVGDADVLNFALNLEYLEAEFYQRAANGTTLKALGVGGTSTATVTGGGPATFTDPQIQSFAKELAANELAHVQFLRSALGTAAVPEPDIDLVGTFTALGNQLGDPTFDPFTNQTDFLLASFLFEDVGVTAYLGGVPFLTVPAYILAAAKIYSVEAYHAGGIRALLIQQGGAALNTTVGISDARDKADGVSLDKDQPAILDGKPNYAPTDETAFTFSRSTGEVIKIVTLGAKNNQGGFFPNGLNGTVK